MGRPPACECQRCGACCQTHFSVYAMEPDLARWRAEGRTDILRLMEDEDAAWSGKQLVSAVTGEPLSPCPFLQKNGNGFACAIYATRPDICSELVPGTAPVCPQYTQ